MAMRRTRSSGGTDALYDNEPTTCSLMCFSMRATNEPVNGTRPVSVSLRKNFLEVSRLLSRKCMRRNTNFRCAFGSRRWRSWK